MVEQNVIRLLAFYRDDWVVPMITLLLKVFSLFEVQARWYLKAAEGGYVRAMYNTAICYSVGEGLSRSHKLARKWMKRAADRGHSKAQFEHGLSLFSVSRAYINPPTALLQPFPTSL